MNKFLPFTLFFILSYLTQVSLSTASFGVGDREFLGEVKSLLPKNYNHSFDDPEEEGGSLLEEYRDHIQLNPSIYEPRNSLSQENSGPSRPSVTVMSHVRREKNVPDPVVEEDSLEEQDDLSLEDIEAFQNQKEESDPVWRQEDSRDSNAASPISELGIETGDASIPPEHANLSRDIHESALQVRQEYGLNSLERPSGFLDPLSLQTVSENRPPQLDFGMASFGLEAGMAIPLYSYTASVGVGSKGSFAGQHGALGLRFTVEKLMRNDWTAGVTSSFRYTFGEMKATHNPTDVFSQEFKARNTQRYELAAKFGRSMGLLHPYIKAGAVAGNFLLGYSDATTASGSKEKFLWGGMMGAGVDTYISKGLLLGGMVEYDYYSTYRGNLANVVRMYETYKVSPKMVNIMFTLTYKLDRKKI